MNIFSQRPRISKTPREIFFGNKTFNYEHCFPTNFISTAKYTAISFLPLAILLQFKRYANIYFLVTAILQSIPQISPLSSATAWAPLIFVVGLSVLREGIEDFNRHKSDRELNSTMCKVYRQGKFSQVQWADILIGDLVLVEETEFFPADIVLLTSSIDTGVCYIETSSLDGEKNLKPKMSLKETNDKFSRTTPDPVLRLEGKINCEPPNTSLYSFSGSLTVRGVKVILNSKQLLLRGAILKNTKWILGVAVYTGVETRIMLNSNEGRWKQSKVEKMTNQLILFIFLFQMICCLICSIGSGFFYYINGNASLFVYQINSSGLEGFLSFFTYFLLVNTMIPISLIVSLEMVKMFQAYFISGDQDLYDLEKGRYAKVFTTSINEELGMVEYIFSDKTGTLTCNKMEFKIAMIGTHLHGDKRIIHDKSSMLMSMPTYVDKKEGVIYSFDDKRLRDLLDRKWDKTDDINGTFISNEDLSYKIYSSTTSEILYEIKTQYDLSIEYFKLLSTCHECVIDSEQNKEMKMIRYQGPSPDEITLVDTARHLGFVFLGNSTGGMDVSWFNEQKKIELLKLFEFNSNRKRMTVIIRDGSVIKLYCKGADSIIKSRLDMVHAQPFLKNIDMQLDEFSKRGLRTLLLSFKVLTEKEYKEFDKEFNALADDPERDKKIDELADKLERGLFLLGATAVEDKLQDMVPETIHDFIAAKIKVWMLTGDKLETAENIGRSCNLIQNHFAVLKTHYSSNSNTSFKECLQNVLSLKEEYKKIKKPKGFVIEGDDLTLILKDEQLQRLFIDIVRDCEAVICCRVTPKQKADVVWLVKRYLKKITLSIGDGANDVNMIQEAHIGVGLYGEEGMRAVQASDFAFVKFKSLWRLLFVHGKWSYIRISEMILYFFYKNMVFTIVQFYYSFTCGFSGMTIYDDYYITFYNLVFTALPVIFRAILEQDVYYRFPLKINKEDAREDREEAGEEEILPYEEHKLIKKYFPYLYFIGQKNTIFTFKNFFVWVFQGAIHGLLIFLFNMYIFEYQLTDTGENTDMWIMSITIYTSIILVVDIKIAAHTQYWTATYAFIIIFTSLCLYFSYIWISDQFIDFKSYQTARMLFQTANFYLTAVVCMGIVFSFDILALNIRALSNKNSIEKLKIGLKMGYAKSETFFKNLFVSEAGSDASKRNIKNEKNEDMVHLN